MPEGETHFPMTPETRLKNDNLTGLLEFVNINKFFFRLLEICKEINYTGRKKEKKPKRNREKEIERKKKKERNRKK